MTPCTAGTRVDGTAGLAGESLTARPSDSLACTSGTAKADATCKAVPFTGIRSPSEEVAPTDRPVDTSHDRVARTVAGVGPKAAAR